MKTCISLAISTLTKATVVLFLRLTRTDPPHLCFPDFRKKEKSTLSPPPPPAPNPIQFGSDVNKMRIFVKSTF